MLLRIVLLILLVSLQEVTQHQQPFRASCATFSEKVNELKPEYGDQATRTNPPTNYLSVVKMPMKVMDSWELLRGRG